MKPNRKQRNKIYKKALEIYLELENPFFMGFCKLLMITASKIHIYITDYYSDIIDSFPEIEKHRPSDAKTFWFPTGDKEIRINILNQAIRETESTSSLWKRLMFWKKNV